MPDITNDLEHLFKPRSKEELERRYGIGKKLRIVDKIAAWVKKMWDCIDNEDPPCISDARLKEEFGTQEITEHIREQLKKRGVVLRKVKRKVGPNEYLYWSVLKK